jgi:hypothetical protein
MILRSITASLAIALASCNAAGRDGDAPDAEADTPSSNAVADLGLAPVGTPAPPEAAAMTLALDDEGLRLIDPTSGSARPLPFGTPMATAIAAATSTFGGPPIEQSVNQECGAGPVLHARWPNGFVALSQEDRFLGWDSREPGLTTADGIGIGSTRAELEASRRVEVEETTLGVEFSAGGLGGLFGSAESMAPITSLWAGLTCHFR